VQIVERANAMDLCYCRGLAVAMINRGNIVRHQKQRPVVGLEVEDMFRL
jgi:hypothetical protein